MKLNEAIKSIICNPVKEAKESLKPHKSDHDLIKAHESVNQAVDLFKEFDAQNAEDFFAQISEFYSQGVDDEDENDMTKMISQLLDRITIILKNRKSN